MKKIVLPILCAQSLLIGLVIAWQWSIARAPAATNAATPVQVGEQAPDFILDSADGPVQLSGLSGGRILFFGFSHCPDVCPTGLATLSAALHQLSAEERAHLQGLFISLDPERDSPERLTAYTAWFNADLRGLTGSAAAIAEIARAYGVFYRRVELPDSALKYSIDHSAHYYLIDADQRLRARVPHGSSVATLVSALRQLLPAAPATHSSP